MHILTSHMPSKSSTSAPGPSEYAKVQIASALLSVYAARRLFNPTCPISARNHFLPRSICNRWGIYIYGPGNPPNALNPRAVSSVITGPPICYQDGSEWTVQSRLLVDICELQHLLWTLALHPLVISEFDIERLQSKARLLNGMLRLPCDRMCFTSSSFLLLPVTKANKVSSTVDWEWGLTNFFWPRHGSFA
jgi:hypothetical protein